MVNRRHYQFLLGGLLVVMSFAAGYGLVPYRTQPAPRQTPRQITVHVSGAPGMMVSGAFEIHAVQVAPPRQTPLPAQFSYTGGQVAFTVERVSGPDEPIVAVVDIDGVYRGVGTAAGGVRIDIWSGDAEPRFLAVPSEPEWKETKEANPPPDLIGTRAPEWSPVEWINTEPPRLADLRGKVVLARWFTGPHCEYCAATAPALREFHQRYSGRGLAVVGMYFHSDDTLEEVRKIVDEYGYRFPVGIDRGAKTRRRWCLGRYDYGYTSATFLLDRDGVIRYIHPGGQYVKDDADYQMLESQIEHWLAH